MEVKGLAVGVSVVSAGTGFSADGRGDHVCVVTVPGGVKCWGGNESGQLGDGTTNSRTAPVDVDGLRSGVALVSAGSRHTCAVTTPGDVKCWGAGDLGDGSDFFSENRLLSAPRAGRNT